jgi:hypothetical protein
MIGYRLIAAFLYIPHKSVGVPSWPLASKGIDPWGKTVKDAAKKDVEFFRVPLIKNPG